MIMKSGQKYGGPDEKELPPPKSQYVMVWNSLTSLCYSAQEVSFTVMEEKNMQDPRLENHPCFNKKACHTYARIHLPVAPRCNVQCRFCDRKFSCVNESRPGVTAKVMSPGEAVAHLERNMGLFPNISVVGIAGPGDPFANPDAVLETFRLVKENFPGLMLCVSTNGLQILPYVNDIKELGVSHVTITVNAVHPVIGAAIYKYITLKDGTPASGEEAARYLWDQQQKAIRALVARGILVKVNTVCIPTVNISHIEQISKSVAALGASIHNVIPIIPVPGTDFACIHEPTAEEIKLVRSRAERHLPQMTHCARCRADAVGLLGDSSGQGDFLKFTARVQGKNSTESLLRTKPGHESRPHIAVVSREGLFVNCHLGEAKELRIYDVRDKKPVLVDIRKMPPADTEERWKKLCGILPDCSLLIAAGAGPVPRAILAEAGIQIRIAQGLIPDSIKESSEKPVLQEAVPFQCGASCHGSADGCGGEKI
jgi:nitrogen fixation protein NifB